MYWMGAKWILAVLMGWGGACFGRKL